MISAKALSSSDQASIHQAAQRIGKSSQGGGEATNRSLESDKFANPSARATYRIHRNRDDRAAITLSRDNDSMRHLSRSPSRRGLYIFPGAYAYAQRRKSNVSRITPVSIPLRLYDGPVTALSLRRIRCNTNINARVRRRASERNIQESISSSHA